MATDIPIDLLNQINSALGTLATSNTRVSDSLNRIEHYLRTTSPNSGTTTDYLDKILKEERKATNVLKEIRTINKQTKTIVTNIKSDTSDINTNTADMSKKLDNIDSNIDKLTTTVGKIYDKYKASGNGGSGGSGGSGGNGGSGGSGGSGGNGNNDKVDLTTLENTVKEIRDILKSGGTPPTPPPVPPSGNPPTLPPGNPPTPPSGNPPTPPLGSGGSGGSSGGSSNSDKTNHDMTEQGQKRKTHNNSMSLGDDDDYDIRKFTSRNKYVGGYDNRDLYNARGHIVGEYGKEFSSMFASNTDDMIQALDNLQNLSTDLNTLGQSLNIRIDRLVQSEIRLQQLADNYKYLQNSQGIVQGSIDKLLVSFNATATETEKQNYNKIKEEYEEAVSNGKSQTEIDAIIAKISTIPNTVSSELVKQYRELEKVRTESVKAQNQFNEESGKVQYEQRQVETEREYVENYADSMKELSDTYSNNSSTVYDYKSRAYSLIPEQNREELSEADKKKAHKAKISN